MRYFALATDYDGTLAHHGRVDDATTAALRRLRDTGRRHILITGRHLDDLLAAFPHAGLCDRIVAENGALVYDPRRRRERILGPPPPADLIDRLKQRGVRDLGVGRVIINTRRPHERDVLEVSHDLGLEHHIIFNKDAVMVLPRGLNKAVGLSAALGDLGLATHECVGVGDAENDLAFLERCSYAVAVANALPVVKHRVDSVTAEPDGAGVRALIATIASGRCPDPTSQAPTADC